MLSGLPYMQPENERIFPAIRIRTLIRSSRAAVWKALTDPGQMSAWMGDPDAQISVDTSWQTGSPVIVSGRHNGQFENRGTVLKYQPYECLSYSHLSSLTVSADADAKAVIVTFSLAGTDELTMLDVLIDSVTDEIVCRHLDLYWRVTLNVIRDFVESQAQNNL